MSTIIPMRAAELGPEPALEPAHGPAHETSRPWYRHRWPWLVMLGPFLVVLAASYSGWLAFTRQDAMVVDDYYKQGMAINQDLRRAAAAANLGLSFSAAYDPATGKLTGSIASFGQAIPARMRIALIHSTVPSKDLRLEAHADRQGVFNIALPDLEASRWQVVVEDEGRTWRLSGNWSWPQQRKMEIKTELPPAE